MFLQDLQNADCILIQGSNMAENHPVGFQWVMKAKERGAKIIHVDPRFTRTSAVADIHATIRPSSDIAFLGGLIRYILENNHYFHEYVVEYTNASFIINEKYQDTEDLDGLFGGWEPDKASYDFDAWMYKDPIDHSGEKRDGHSGQGHSERAAMSRGGKQDKTLQDPFCVFQILKRHYQRYTPEMVEEICGTPAETFLKIAETLCANSGRERTSSICYAVGWTHHLTGAQIIRAASIVQMLLGNMGRPGGGILALRGHASIQGSTDIPTLFNLLPGYIAMPRAKDDPDFAAFCENEVAVAGWWGEAKKYIVSLLKAWYGDAAQEANGYCFDHLPRLTGDHSHMTSVVNMIDRAVKGYFVMGENPTVGSPHAGMQREGLRNLEWCVVRDLVMIETAEFWKDSPEAEDIATEVFFFPAAAHTEKDGSFTNTQRLLQWHHKAVEPPGDCRSELHFIYHLGRRLRELYADSTDPKDRALLDLTWDYPTHGVTNEPSAEAVLREINGYTCSDGKVVNGYTDLKDDGSTACGCWIYSGIYKDGRNQCANRKSRDEQDWVAKDWGWAWPHNRRTLYNRASADPEGRPWSERKKYVWWDEAAKKWTGYDEPDFIVDRPPSYRPAPDAKGKDTLSGTDPFLMQADGKAWLFAPLGLHEGPLPSHYEPLESVVKNALYGQQCNPVRMEYRRAQNPLHRPYQDERFPYMLTTYRLTEHHTAGGMSRWLSWLSELQPEMFCEVSPELAAAKKLKNGGWATISTARAAIEARVLVTRRIQSLKIGRRTFEQIGLPYHWGGNGLSRGGSANDLLCLSSDPNVSIMNSKAHTANIEPGRHARFLRPQHAVIEGPPLPGAGLRDLPQAAHREVGKHLVATSHDKQGEQT
jgi:formate dehydrogenase major subunit